MRGKCYLIISINWNSTDTCDNMDPRLAYYDECQKNIAVNTENIEGCKDRFRDQCILEIVTKTKDTSQCKMINDKKLAQKCLSQPDTIKCSSYTHAKGYCYYSVAINEKNFNMCSQTVNSGMQYTCYRDLALIKNDDSICDEITFSAGVKQSAIERMISECHDDVATGERNSSFP